MDAVDWLTRADKLTANQEWVEAANAYEQALKLDPTNASIHNQIGIIGEELGHLDKAENAYQAALDLDYDFADAHYNLGLLYKSEGRKTEAQNHLESFLRLVVDPEDEADAKEMLTDLSGLSYEKCTKCGYISTLSESFKNTNEGPMCPRCYSETRLEKVIRSNAFMGTALLIWVSFGIFAYSVSGLPLHYLPINLLTLVIFIPLLVVPHELSHAIGAWLAKGRVFEIRLGVGSIILKKVIGNLTLSLCKYPFSGICMGAFPNRQHIKLRSFIFVLGGILFHTLMILLLLPNTDFSRITSSYAFAEAFVLANMGLLLVNILPRQININGLSINSDGANLIRIISSKFRDDVQHALYFFLESLYSFGSKNYKQTIKWCEAGLHLFPDNLLLKNNLALALLELGRHTEALALFKELIASKDQEFLKEFSSETQQLVWKAFFLNNFAYATLLNNPSSKELDKAYEYSLEAFRMIPWEPSIEGTLGAILVETGAIKEGIEHLTRAYKHYPTNSNKAINLAHTAIGYHRIGDTEKASELLKEAIKLDSDDYIIKKAQAEIASV